MKLGRLRPSSFTLGKHKTQDSVGYAKKYFEKFGELYGMMSEISHQSKYELVVRQMVRLPQGVFISHVKEINSDHFIAQNNCLTLIMYLLRLIAELAEEICIDHISKPYFWEKTSSGSQRKLDTPEDQFIQDFIQRAAILLKSDQEKRSKIANP